MLILDDNDVVIVARTRTHSSDQQSTSGLCDEWTTCFDSLEWELGETIAISFGSSCDDGSQQIASMSLHFRERVHSFREISWQTDRIAESKSVIQKKNQKKSKANKTNNCDSSVVHTLPYLGIGVGNEFRLRWKLSNYDERKNVFHCFGIEMKLNENWNNDLMQMICEMVGKAFFDINDWRRWSTRN